MKKGFICVIISVLTALSMQMISYALGGDIDISIEMDSALGNIYEKGEAGFSVQASNPGEAEVSLAVNYSVIGITYENDSFSGQELIKVFPNGEQRFSFSLPQDRYGMYKLNVSVSGAEDFSADFAVIPHYEKQFLEEYTRRGVATQYERGGRTDSHDRILMEKAGVRHIRDGIIWIKHEKSKGLFDYSYTDSWYERAAENTHSVVMGLWYNNPFYNGNKSDKYGVSGQYQIEAYANYARNMARRYRDVSEFEIWNEPDYGSFWLPAGNAFDYINMLKTASLEIKQINPNTGIAAGALSKTSETDFMRQVFAYGGYPYFDTVSLHPYVSPQYSADDEYSLSRYESYKNLITEYGGWKDIIATEVGWPTHKEGAAPEKQAQQLVKQNVIADKYGFLANEWFSFRDAGNNQNNKEDNFGILRNDYTPKPAYFALCAMNQFLAGAVYCGEASWMTGAEAHLYMKNGSPILVAWSREEPASITGMGDDTETFDLYGNRYTDQEALPADGTPVYFVNADYSAADRVLLESAEIQYMEFFQKYGGYLSQSARAEIQQLMNNREYSTDIDSAANQLNAHYSCGVKMINEFVEEDIALLSGMLYDWHHIGETIGKLYLKYELAEKDVNYNARHEIRCMNYGIKTKNRDSNTDILPYSQSIARFAERYCTRAFDVRNMKLDKMKYSYSKMCNDISRNLAIMANMLSQKENGENHLILIGTPSTGLALEGSTSKIIVTVKNYKRDSITGKLDLYAADGTLLSASDMQTLIPLVSQEFELAIDAELYEAAADGTASLRFMQGENTVAYQEINFIKK